MTSSDGCCDDDPRQSVSLSLPFHSSRRKRTRLARLPALPSACEESAHYPVFDPQDPRHNPAVRTNSWPDNDYDLPQTAYSKGSMRWMQSLPGRSLQRARSGLLALRSGLHKRPFHRTADCNDAIPGLWSSSDSTGTSYDQHERRFSSAISEASTEEDYDFGTDLYRTDCNYPSNVKEAANKELDVLSYIPCSPSTALTASSTVADGHQQVLLAEITPSACPKEPAVAKSVESDSPQTNHDLEITSESHCAEETPTTVEQEPGPAEHSSPPAPGTPTSSSSIASTHDIILGQAEDSSEAKPNPSSTEMENNPQAPQAKDERPPSFLSRSPSSTRSTESKDHQAPVFEIYTSQQTEESPPSALSLPESPHNLEQDIEPTPAVEAVETNELDIPAPEHELPNVRYYLSLNALAGHHVAQFDSSEEEPSSSSFRCTSEENPNSPPTSWLPSDKGDSPSHTSLPLRDEYFLIDGKSSDLHPDRGDNPIKEELRFTGDGGLYRNPPIRTQEIHELIRPGGPFGIPSPQSYRAEREGSDSTDEYLVTYSFLHRHYFS